MNMDRTTGKENRRMAVMRIIPLSSLRMSENRACLTARDDVLVSDNGCQETIDWAPMHGTAADESMPASWRSLHGRVVALLAEVA